jgi:hypothetical protein
MLKEYCAIFECRSSLTPGQYELCANEMCHKKFNKKNLTFQSNKNSYNVTPNGTVSSLALEALTSREPYA